jgi:transposase
MMIYEQTSNAGIPISGAGIRRHLPHSTPPGSGCSPFTNTTWLGHEVRLIHAKFVRPFVKTNKNDWNDAAAICEAAQRPTMRFVATKSLEQQDLLAIHRIRERLVSQRTGLCNQIRGLLAEYGIVLPQAIARLRRALPEVLEDAENELTVRGRELIASMRRMYVRI